MKFGKFGELLQNAIWFSMSILTNSKKASFDTFGHSDPIQKATNGQNKYTTANHCHIQEHHILYPNGNDKPK